MQYIKTKNLTQKKQVLCGLRGIFLLFSCQTPVQCNNILTHNIKKIHSQCEKTNDCRRGKIEVYVENVQRNVIDYYEGYQQISFNHGKEKGEERYDG